MASKWSAAAVCVVITLTATAGFADIVYKARSPPLTAADEINGSQGADTARSFAAAARMSHKFFRGQTPVDEDSIVNACKAATPNLNHWPEGCDPAGMTTALRQWYNWVLINYPEAQQLEAIGTQLEALKNPNLQSPNVVPIYGQADHWASVWKVETDDMGALRKVHYLDGGPGGHEDSSGTSYVDGFKAASASVWKMQFYLVIYSVAEQDPFFRRFVTLYEPPPGTPTPTNAIQFADIPSPLRAGEQPSAALARTRARDALHLATVDQDEELWTAFKAGEPGPAHLVNGVWPDGSDWDYYLVPFLNEREEVVAMALLDARRLTYQLAWALARPRPFDGLSAERARHTALAHLRSGETLGTGVLTWDPAGPASTPTFPYYEFPIQDTRRLTTTAVRVQLDGGRLRSLDAAHMSRRSVR